MPFAQDKFFILLNVHCMQYVLFVTLSKETNKQKRFREMPKIITYIIMKLVSINFGSPILMILNFFILVFENKLRIKEDTGLEPSGQ